MGTYLHRFGLAFRTQPTAHPRTKESCDQKLQILPQPAEHHDILKTGFSDRQIAADQRWRTAAYVFFHQSVCPPISGHLRPAFLTSAARRGASPFIIIATSRHRSIETLTAYVREEESFKHHAGARLH
ncbi:MAG: hypothetical protein Q8M24_23015 [Pseudolabrys sp.]|nr:hypothetical protein [Pseudolabrys sp.]